MSVPYERRKQACLQQIANEFDTDKTVAWMLQKFAQDETIMRAKNPEKLCRNIVTFGGSGRERDDNGRALIEALNLVHAKDVDALRKQLDIERIDKSELHKKVEDLQDAAIDLERTNHNLLMLAMTEGRNVEAEEAVAV